MYSLKLPKQQGIHSSSKPLPHPFPSKNTGRSATTSPASQPKQAKATMEWSQPDLQACHPSLHGGASLTRHAKRYAPISLRRALQSRRLRKLDHQGPGLENGPPCGRRLPHRHLCGPSLHCRMRSATPVDLPCQMERKHPRGGRTTSRSSPGIWMF